MLSQFKIGARLGGAFAIILLLLLAASGTGLFSVTRIADTTREALETDGALASNAGVVRRLAVSTVAAPRRMLPLEQGDSARVLRA